ncbi:MAG: BamA/TamA family outer membrane protein [Gemmatimonadales bacterium]
MVAALLAFGAAPLLAQQRWVDSRYPYITASANDFPVFAARFLWTRRARDYFSPLPYAGNLSLDVGLSLKGSYFAMAKYHLPGIRDGWRLLAQARATRESRFGYFGVGNNTRFDDNLITDAQPFLYRVKREQTAAQVEVSRRIKGPFRVSLATGVQRTEFKELPGPSVFRQDNPPNLTDTDVTGRLSLMLDTRDNEYNTHRGLFLETGALAGSGGDGYTRLYANLRGYLPLREGTVVALRLLGAGLGGDPPLEARFELPMWENTIEIFGGTQTDRAFDDGRFAGKHVLLGNLEVRHDILNLETLGAITAIGFVDAGRVFEGEPFKLTTKDVKWGGGGGIAIRLLRSTIFTFNLAKGEEGWNFSVGNGWLF